MGAGIPGMVTLHLPLISREKGWRETVICYGPGHKIPQDYWSIWGIQGQVRQITQQLVKPCQEQQKERHVHHNLQKSYVLPKQYNTLKGYFTDESASANQSI